jgi:hypothetical protein
MDDCWAAAAIVAPIRPEPSGPLDVARNADAAISCAHEILDHDYLQAWLTPTAKDREVSQYSEQETRNAATQ